MAPYQIISDFASIKVACSEVYGLLGKGLPTIIYKDALELTFRHKGIKYLRKNTSETIEDNSMQPSFIVFEDIVIHVFSTNSKTGTKIESITSNELQKDCSGGLQVIFGDQDLKFNEIHSSETQTR